MTLRPRHHCALDFKPMVWVITARIGVELNA